MVWVRVRLADAWDLAGSNVTALGSYFADVFTERFVPEFTMLSLDHKAMLNTTVWGNGTVSTIDPTDFLSPPDPRDAPPPTLPLNLRTAGYGQSGASRRSADDSWSGG